MTKRGPQLHDCYFKKYVSIFTNKDNTKTKTEQEKLHTKSFRNYKFTDVISDIAKKHKIIETFPDYDLNDKKISEMIMYLFYPHAQMAKTTLQGTNTLTIDDYINDLTEKLIERYKKNELDSDFSEYVLLNDALSSFDNDALKKEIRSKINKKNTYPQATYEKLDESYGFFLANKLSTDNNDTMFFNKSYSGLVMYLISIKHKFSWDRINNDILYNYIDYYRDNVMFADDIISNELLPIYSELFDTDSEFYIELESENKVLEQQFLDIYFGLSASGYVVNQLKKHNLTYHYTDDYDEFINDNTKSIECYPEEFSRLGIFGLSQTTKNIINIAIEKDIEYQEQTINENFSLEDTNNSEDIVTQFIKQMLEVFYEFTQEFVRYLHFLGDYKKRIDYVKGLNISHPKMTDDWKYLKNTECNEAYTISSYIESLSELSFFKKYTFNKKHFYINGHETYPVFAELLQKQQREERKRTKNQP